jgi:hypothetical protein
MRYPKSLRAMVGGRGAGFNTFDLANTVKSIFQTPFLRLRKGKGQAIFQVWQQQI